MEHHPRPNLDQNLHEIGVTQTALNFIRAAAAQREPHRFEITSGFESGDYNKYLTLGLGKMLPTPFIDVPTTRLERQGVLRKKTEVPSIERKAIEPANIAEQTANYAQELLAQGKDTVRIVDFGAGSARTVYTAANLLAEEIASGKVSILATNYDTAPRPIHETNRIERKMNEHNHPEFANAYYNGRITYKQADILELYNSLQGTKIDLLFMVNTFSSTKEYNDSLLKIVGDMVNPEVGTVVFGFGSLIEANTTSVTTGKSFNAMVGEGLSDLQLRGFTRKDAFETLAHETNGSSSPSSVKVGVKNLLDVYQAPHAPKFNLLQTA